MGAAQPKIIILAGDINTLGSVETPTLTLIVSPRSYILKWCGNMPHDNVFGIPRPKGIKHNAPRTELVRILKLENNPEIVEGIKKLWQRTADRYLHADKSLNEQKEAFKLIAAKLRKKCRLFLEGDQAETALYLTLRWLYNNHCHMRWRQAVKGGVPHHPTPLQQASKKHKRPIVKKLAKATLGSLIKIGCPTPAVASPAHNAPQNIVAPEPGPSQLEPCLVMGPLLNRQPEVMTEQSSGALDRQSTVDDEAVDECTPSFGRHGSALAQLLFKCSPSMTHLLPVFEQLGVSQSEEYLVGISTWKSEVIHAFLQEVNETAWTMGIPLRVVDIFVLKNAFLTYFH